jgi:hypothetical protein
MISPTTLSVHDANEIRACVEQDAAEAFDRQVGMMMTWYAWDESERNEAVVAWLAYALRCWAEIGAEHGLEHAYRINNLP